LFQPFFWCKQILRLLINSGSTHTIIRLAHLSLKSNLNDSTIAMNVFGHNLARAVIFKLINHIIEGVPPYIEFRLINDKFSFGKKKHLRLIYTTYHNKIS
jgi:hypothetical protein